MTKKKRDQIFEETKHFVEMTVRKHWIILRSCHMELEDVTQSLYLRLLELIGRYEPKKCSNLEAYLMQGLQFRLWNLATGSKRFGMPGAPVRGFRVISLETMTDYYEPVDPATDSAYSSLWLEQAVAKLPSQERKILNAYVNGSRKIRCTNRALRSARRYLIAGYEQLSHLSA